jgi:hypothetical protein
MSVAKFKPRIDGATGRNRVTRTSGTPRFDDYRGLALFERRHQKSDLMTVGRHKC